MQQSMFERDLDVTKRDRFELLSAYLDGEVTPEERHLVQNWLATDASAKCLYQRLLQLRQGFQNLPSQPCDSDNTLSEFFCLLNRRLRLACMAGAGVCALGVLGMLSGVFGPRHGLMQWVALPGTSDASYTTLQVSLDQPVFSLPDTVEAVDPSAEESLIPVESEM